MRELEVRFLEEGKQSPEDIAQYLASFLDQARQSIEIAVYDTYLPGKPGQMVIDALKRARGRGVDIRAAFSGEPRESSAHGQTKQTHAEQFFESAGIGLKPIVGEGTIMHDKYVVLDQGSEECATVWTGSTNWTTDSWGRESNAIFIIPSQGLAHHFHSDFEQLWKSGKVCGTGRHAGGFAEAQYAGKTVDMYVWFTPDRADALLDAIGEDVRHAQRRIFIASPVITANPVIAAFQDVLKEHRHNLTIGGEYDGSQMADVLHQWKDNGHEGWKILTVTALNNFLAAKPSTPYEPGQSQDFSHLKMLVVDDKVYSGSYNFSHSGEYNAENVVRITSAELADTCVGFIQALMKRFGHKGSPIETGLAVGSTD